MVGPVILAWGSGRAALWCWVTRPLRRRRVSIASRDASPGWSVEHGSDLSEGFHDWQVQVVALGGLEACVAELFLGDVRWDAGGDGEAGAGGA